MSFGFGVGDFIAISDLTLKLYKAFKNASDEFLEISRELQSFHIVIADLKEQAEDPKSLLNRCGTTRRDELITTRDSLISTMGELQELHEKYRRMGRLSWSRVGLGMTDLVAMRSKLTIQISALNTFFIGSLNMTTLSKMEPMLERILHFFGERVKGDLGVAQSVLSAMSKNDEDGVASWAMLEMELKTEGIPSKYIGENREQIMEVLGSVIEHNLQEGDHGGTIYAEDSVSQIGKHQGDQGEGSGGSRTASPKFLTSQKQRPQLVRYWSSKLKIPLRSAASVDNLGPEVTKSQLLPYQDWVSQLSSEENKTRIMLMNRGFDIQEIESEIASSSKLALFKGGSKTGNISERAICWAVLNKEELAVRMLLARGCNLSSRHERRNIAALAAEAGNWDMVTMLIKSGTDIHAGYNIELARRDENGDCWVPRGTHRGELQLSSFKERHFLGKMGLLHIAAASNRCDIITLLLDLGTNVDSCMKSSRTILSKLYDKDLPEHLSWSALHVATQKCSIEAVELLLKRGTDANKKTSKGDNALKFAIMGKMNKRREGLVLLLLKYGADVNAQDRDGWTLLLHATKPRLDDNEDIIITTKREDKRNLDLIQLLLDNGAKINASNSNGTTPIFIAIEEAARRGNPDIVLCLLEAGANVNARNKHGLYPLHIATTSGNVFLVKLLLDKGAQIGSKMDGYDLLYIAARSESDDEACIVTKLLVDAGADASILSKEGTSLDEVARNEGNYKLSLYLVWLDGHSPGL